MYTTFFKSACYKCIFHHELTYDEEVKKKMRGEICDIKNMELKDEYPKECFYREEKGEKQ